MAEASDSNVDHGLLNERIRTLRELEASGRGSGGGGPDAWQQSVENRLSDLQAELRALRSDLAPQSRWLLGIMLGAFAGVLGVMAKGRLAMRPPRLVWIGLGLGLLLSGCAQPTPYQPAAGGYGYADQQIEQNRYRVSFAGNAVTSRDTVQNFLLLRAAELTQATGNDHFTVVDRGLERSTGYHGSAFGNGVGWGDDGWSGFGTSTYSAYPIDSYTAFADIVVGKGLKPAGDVDAYDARDVQARLGATAVRPNP